MFLKRFARGRKWRAGPPPPAPEPEPEVPVLTEQPYPIEKLGEEKEEPMATLDITFPRVRTITSPNRSARSNGVASVKGGLVHWTGSSADAVGIALYFKNPASRVSAHSVVGRNGLAVRCVPPKYKAWHAGPSKYDFNHDGKLQAWEYDLNNDTIGIEACHKPGQNWPDIQIRALAREFRFYNRVCPNFRYAYIIDHEAASHMLTGKWDVDHTFPAARMFWFIIKGPKAKVPKNVYHELPKWAQRQSDVIKKEW